MAWWGGDARHEMMNTLLDLFEQRNPGITISREYSDFGPYWDKLSTQVAGGNAPDLMHFNLSYTGEYVEKGVVLNLASLIDSGTLNVADFDPVVLDSGKVDGELYYVSLGNSAPSAVYNTAMFARAEVAPPSPAWTWDDFVKTATDVTTALGQGFYGSSDQAAYGDAIEVFLRQRGKSLFAPEGIELNFAEQDLADWLAMWDGLRQAGAIPPTDVAVESAQKAETSVLATGKAAIHFHPANNLKVWQRLLTDDLSLVGLPLASAGEEAGYFVVGAYLGVSAKTEHPDECAAVINFMVNDPEAARIYKAEHGPPGSLAMREVVAPVLDPSDQEVFAFMVEVTQSTTPISPQPRPYAEILDLLSRTNQDIGFGAKSVEQAVDDFFSESETILL
jgi:multiple sugar transport system substrate-binding protein